MLSPEELWLAEREYRESVGVVIGTCLLVFVAWSMPEERGDPGSMFLLFIVHCL